MRSLLALTLLLAAALSQAQSKPNIIFIIVDDLGYGDLGSTWQDARQTDFKFDTPSLDKFAREGVTLTRHYCPAPVCAPSRASLMSGVHQGHSNIRDNQFDKVLEDNHTLGTVLRTAGYHTAAVGKWGIAGRENDAEHPGHPLHRGFNDFLGYLFHADGHEHYPQDGTTDKQAFIYHGFQKLPTVGKAYTADLFTAYAKEVIKTQTQQTPEKPFFLYLSYDTPHFKMQVPSAGYPEFRPAKGKNALTGGIQWTGPSGFPLYVNTAVGQMDSYFYPEHKAAWPGNSRIHATMIRRIDDGIGDIMQLLKDLKIDDNTLVVFTSDNGPHNEGNNPRHFESYANMDGIKRDVWEAGIRVPTLARWPQAIPANTKSANPSQFHDWLPTLAKAAQTTPPARTDGVNLLPSLTGKGKQDPSTVYIEYNVGGRTPNWEEFHPSRRNQPRGQMQVLIQGDYKGIRTNIQSHTDDFQIYNVATDPKETTNLANRFPNLQSQFKNQVLRLRRPNPSAPRPYLDDLPVPSVPLTNPKNGARLDIFRGKFPYVPDLTNQVPVESTVVSAIEPALTMPGEYALRFSGYIQVPFPGDYHFTLRTDTGGLLKIHHATVVDADFNYEPGQEAYGMIKLKPGYHPFTLTIRSTSDKTPQLDLLWAGPGQTQLPITGLVHR